MSNQQQIRGRSRPGRTPALTGRRSTLGGGGGNAGGGVKGGPVSIEGGSNSFTGAAANRADSDYSTGSTDITGTELENGAPQGSSDIETAPSRMQYQPYTVAHPILNFLSGGKASDTAASLNEKMQMQQMSEQSAVDNMKLESQLRDSGNIAAADRAHANALALVDHSEQLKVQNQNQEDGAVGKAILQHPDSDKILQDLGYDPSDPNIDPVELGKTAKVSYGDSLKGGLNNAQNVTISEVAGRQYIPALTGANANSKLAADRLTTDSDSTKTDVMEDEPDLARSSIEEELQRPGIVNDSMQTKSDNTGNNIQHIGKFGDNGNMFMSKDADGNAQIHILQPQQPIDPKTGKPDLMAAPMIGHKVMDLQTGMVKDFNATQPGAKTQTAIDGGVNDNTIPWDTSSDLLDIPQD